MLITGAVLREISLPLREPFRISGGSIEARRSLLVELKSDSGATGWGEAAPFPTPIYSGETIDGAESLLENLLLPRIVGAGLNATEEVLALMADVRGNESARAAVETAWWDLVACGRGVSLSRLVSERLDSLGVPKEHRTPRGHIESGIALGIPPGGNLELLCEWVRRAAQRGYRRVKLKVRPGWDIEPVQRARAELERIGVNLPMWVDANGSFDPEQHSDLLMALAQEDILFIEQPFPAECLMDSVYWDRRFRVPICLDESLTSDRVARQVVEADGPMIWNLKVQRLGGLDQACRVYARAVREGAGVWVGTMPESGVGALAGLSLAAQGGCRWPSDLEPSERWYEPNTDPIPMSMTRDGMVPVPDRRPEPQFRNNVAVVARFGADPGDGDSNAR